LGSLKTYFKGEENKVLDGFNLVLSAIDQNYPWDPKLPESQEHRKKYLEAKDFMTWYRNFLEERTSKRRKELQILALH